MAPICLGLNVLRNNELKCFIDVWIPIWRMQKYASMLCLNTQHTHPCTVWCMCKWGMLWWGWTHHILSVVNRDVYTDQGYIDVLQWSWLKLSKAMQSCVNAVNWKFGLHGSQEGRETFFFLMSKFTAEVKTILGHIPFLMNFSIPRTMFQSQEKYTFS